MVKVRTVIPVTLLAVTILSVPMLTMPSALADDNSVVTTTTINVPVSCTLSGTVNTAHSATLINGTYSGTNYANGIGSTTIKAFCNDASGFAIYAIGYTNEEYGNNKLHWSGASTLSDNTNAIDTGIYTQGTTANSTWSMKLASETGTYVTTIVNGTNNEENFTTWHEVPDEYTKVAYRTSGTDIEVNGSGLGSSITTTYDAYIAADQPAGSYAGKVKYTLVHPSSEGTPEIPVTIDNIVYMQDLANITPTQYQMFKDSMTEDQQYQLIDIRDNKTYYLAKLKDGNVWMTQNLDLDLVTDGSIIYDNTTTDLGWNSTTGTYGTASWVPPCTVHGRSTDNCPDFSLYDEDYDYVAYYWDYGDYYWDGPGNGTSTSSSGNAHYHLGNGYSWSAAAAMDNGYSTDVDADIIIEQSICPAGWTLPRTNTFWPGYTNEQEEWVEVLGEGTFNGLLTAYDLIDNGEYLETNGQRSIYDAPLYLTHSFGSSTSTAPVGYPYQDGDSSDYWLSTTCEGDLCAYSFHFHRYGYSPGVKPSWSGASRANGHPIRCIVRNPSFSLP